MVFNDLINTINLYATYGLVIQTGTATLLQWPERKETLSNDWREENGKEYDLSSPKFKDREITLKCAFKADDDADFWTNYNAFFAEITQAGWQDLFIADHGKTYQVFYKSTGNFDKSQKRLKNVDKVFVKFDLTLQVQ